MCNMISCLVAKDGTVHAKDGVHSHTQIAIACGVDEDRCLKYEFRLGKRKLFQDFFMEHTPFEAKQSHDQAAQKFFDECAGTPERLMAYVKRGNWDKQVLLNLLTFGVRMKCYRVCDAAEAKCDKVCDAAWVKRNKVRAAAEAKRYKVCDAAAAKYGKACGAAVATCNKACSKVWLTLFKDPTNRIDIWRK